MKYNQFSKKGQEDRNHLLAVAFESILGLGLYTSVVNLFPETMIESKGIKWLERILSIISNNFRDIAIKDSYTFHKAFIS